MFDLCLCYVTRPCDDYYNSFSPRVNSSIKVHENDRKWNEDINNFLIKYPVMTFYFSFSPHNNAFMLPIDIPSSQSPHEAVRLFAFHLKYQQIQFWRNKRNFSLFFRFEVLCEVHFLRKYVTNYECHVQ